MMDKGPLHIQLRVQGAEKWNEWRKNHPEVTEPNLAGANLSSALISGANLARVSLREADLSHADLSNANLMGADLFGANLYNANLSGAALVDASFSSARLIDADLSSANLQGANLADADLDGANLSGANLRTAYLVSTDFSGANLSDVDFSGAVLENANLTGAALSHTSFEHTRVGNTVFVDLDLRGAEGLESMEHTGPSIISISTIYNSEGDIPESFLRGCGVPESFIVQVPALVAAMQPVQFYSCFISYSGKDEGLAQRLHADLQSKGVRCWFAPENLKIGERFRRRIDEVIRVYDRLLLILSENSVASSWVEKEVETAMESEDEQKRTVLFPVRLDDSVMEIKTGWPADVRRTRHIGDFRKWKDHDEYLKAFSRLLADLKAGA